MEKDKVQDGKVQPDDEISNEDLDKVAGEFLQARKPKPVKGKVIPMPMDGLQKNRK